PLELSGRGGARGVVLALGGAWGDVVAVIVPIIHRSLPRAMPAPGKEDDGQEDGPYCQPVRHVRTHSQTSAGHIIVPPPSRLPHAYSPSCLHRQSVEQIVGVVTRPRF